MENTKVLTQYVDDFIGMLKNLDLSSITKLADILIAARDNNAFIYLIGNGGSASTASHWASDLNKGLSFKRDKKFKAICLNDNIPGITAYANDEDYSIAFMELGKNFFRPEDVLIGISGSGSSKNLLNTFEYAGEIGMTRVAVTGYPEAKLKGMAEHVVSAEIKDMQIAEDFHLILDHMLFKEILDREPER